MDDKCFYISQTSIFTCPLELQGCILIHVADPNMNLTIKKVNKQFQYYVNKVIEFQPFIVISGERSMKIEVYRKNRSFSSFLKEEYPMLVELKNTNIGWVASSNRRRFIASRAIFGMSKLFEYNDTNYRYTTTAEFIGSYGSYWGNFYLGIYETIKYNVVSIRGCSSIYNGKRTLP